MQNAKTLLVVNQVTMDDIKSNTELLKALPFDPNELHVLCVVNKLPVYFYQIPTAVDIEDDLMTNAKQHLQEIADELGVPEANRCVKVGVSSCEAQQLAHALAIDTILGLENECHHFDLGKICHSVMEKIHHVSDIFHKEEEQQTTNLQ